MNHDEIEQRFADKNQAYFFQNLFCGSERENGALANEVIRLCQILDARYANHFTEMKILLDESKRHQCNSPAPLSEVYSNFQDKNFLTLYVVACFVAVDINRVSYDRNQYDQYKALTLLVVTHLSFRGDHESKIERLCNELRQYALGKRDQLAAYLPDILHTTFPLLIDELEMLLQSDELQQMNVSRQIANIKVPYQATYEKKRGFHRNVNSREFKREGKLHTAEKKYLDDDSSVSVIEIKELKFGEQGNKSASWVDEEEQSTCSRSISMVTSPTFVNKDYGAQALQARAVNERIRKKSMMLTCDISAMTPLELHHLVVDCIDALKKQDEYQESARILMLMLLTGNGFEEIRAWQARRNSRRKIIGVKRKFKLPSQKLRKELQPFIREVVPEYTLPIPLNLVNDLSNFKFKSTEEKDVKDFLSAIKKRHGIGLTISKITSYLPQTLKGNGIDCTLIDLITGFDAKNQPARFYTHVPYDELITTVKRYFNHINTAAGTEYLLDLDIMGSGHCLGSPLYVETGILKSIFSKIQTKLSDVSSECEHYYSEANHNLRVVYLQLVLGLVSGYRPVEGWFGNIDDIHFSTGEYRIAEKERSTGYSGRTVLLPDIALLHLREYLDYCEKAAIHFSVPDSEMSKRYRQSLDGSMPFCFYRYQERRQEVTPSTYMQHIDPIFPLPANWTRHYLRSLLFSHGISDELIGAWMGHIHSNQLPFAQYSQLSRQELQRLRDLLQEHIISLLPGE
ncbi:hypothetical protein [Vibrio brasiliensis]